MLLLLLLLLFLFLLLLLQMSILFRRLFHHLAQGQGDEAAGHDCPPGIGLQRRPLDDVGERVDGPLPLLLLLDVEVVGSSRRHRDCCR